MPAQPAECVGCPAIEVVGPHLESDHGDDCGYAKWGRTDQVCGGCFGCIAAQVAYYGYSAQDDGGGRTDGD